ncbi:MAG: hypothetical protein J5859_03010 [Clostridia bacterium]|nr:hypothetical protein [Clostridia bacterium]
MQKLQKWISLAAFLILIWAFATGNLGTLFTAAKKLYGYDSASQKVETVSEEIEAVAVSDPASWHAGSYVFFGNYPQGKNGERKPVEWLVLDVREDKALLISRYALYRMSYGGSDNNVLWEDCTVRKWLNDVFLNEAFTPEEQDKILLTEVDNSLSQDSSGRSTSGGKNTQDRIFLLSYNEAWDFFPTDEARKCEGTDYAVYVNWGRDPGYGKNYVSWWLRTPIYYRRMAETVEEKGTAGSLSTGKTGYVRPVFWIDLNPWLSAVS